MNIRIVSSLAPDDETRVAQRILKVLTGLLDQLPIAYSLSVETALGESYRRTRLPCATSTAPAQLESEPERSGFSR